MRPQQTTPTIPAPLPTSQAKKSRLANMIRDKFPGDYDDISDDDLEKQVLAKYPEYQDLVIDQPAKIETEIEAPTFLSRAKEATPKVSNDPTGLYTSSIDPSESLLTSIPKKLLREVDSWIGGFGEHTINTGKQTILDLIEAAKAPDYKTKELLARRAVAKGMYSEVGVPYENLESDVLGGHTGAAIGDVAVPAAMMAGMHYAGKLGGVKTGGINPADLPETPSVRVVPIPQEQLTGRPPTIPPPPKQLPGPGGSTATRLPGTPPTSFTRQPEVPPATPATFVSHPSGAVGDVSNWNTPETLSALNVIRPAEGTTPPIVGNPFKKNALPPIEQLPIVDTSIIEQRQPPIQPQPDIIPQPPPVVRPPQMGMVPTQPREAPLPPTSIVSKFKPDIGPIAEGEPRPVGSGSTVARPLMNRLFGDRTPQRPFAEPPVRQPLPDIDTSIISQELAPIEKPTPRTPERVETPYLTRLGKEYLKVTDPEAYQHAVDTGQEPLPPAGMKIRDVISTITKLGGVVPKLDREPVSVPEVRGPDYYEQEKANLDERHARGEVVDYEDEFDNLKQAHGVIDTMTPETETYVKQIRAALDEGYIGLHPDSPHLKEDLKQGYKVVDKLDDGTLILDRPGKYSKGPRVNPVNPKAPRAEVDTSVAPEVKEISGVDTPRYEPPFKEAKPKYKVADMSFEGQWKSAIKFAEEQGIDWRKYDDIRELRAAAIEKAQANMPRDLKDKLARGMSTDKMTDAEIDNVVNDIYKPKDNDPFHIALKRDELEELMEGSPDKWTPQQERRVVELHDELEEYDQLMEDTKNRPASEPVKRPITGGLDLSKIDSMSDDVLDNILPRIANEKDPVIIQDNLERINKELRIEENKVNPDDDRLETLGALRDEALDRYQQTTGRKYTLPPSKRTNEPALAKAKGGGLVASVNIERAVDNITKDYTGALEGIMVREGGQNGLDATKGMGKKGVVKIRLGTDRGVGISNTNREGAFIEVYDNGAGMDEDKLSNKLVEMFSTGKENDPGAAGGKGIGSASYMFGGKYFEIETVAVDGTDGKKYKIRAAGTKSQFLNPAVGSEWDKQQVSDSTPTGTTIKTILKDGQDLYNAKQMVNKILANSRDRETTIIYDERDGSKGTALKDVKADNTNPYSPITKHTFKESKNDKLVGDFVARNADIKVLVPDFDETISRRYSNIHYLNSGYHQFSEVLWADSEAKGIPDNVIVNITPLVDEMHDDYAFINTREDIKKELREDVQDFLKDNITKPAISRKKNRTQELYDSMTEVKVIGGTKRKVVIFDPGERLTKPEMNRIIKNKTIQDLVRHYDKVVEDMIVASGNTAWGDRLEGIGIVMDPNMHGVHIPNPATKKSTILFNPFIRISGMATPKDAAFDNTITGLHEVAHIGDEHGVPINLPAHYFTDARFGKFIQSYIDQMIRHGDQEYQNTGHGMGFLHRLGTVYATYGPERTFKSADELHAIVTRGAVPGNYSPEIQDLLQLYTEREGRPETTEDLLSGTGVKQANKRPKGKGSIPSDSKTDGVGTTPREQIEPVDWTKAGEVPVNPDDYGQVPKVIKLGKGLSKLKPEPAGKLEYEDLPTAPVKPKRESTLKPGELNTSRFGGGKEPPKEPPNKLTPEAEPEPPEKPKYIPPERIDVIGNIRNTSEKPKEGWKEEVKKKIKEGPVPPTVEKIIADKKAKTAGVDDATFTKAIKSLPKRFRNLTLYKGLYEGVGVSGLTKLKRMGEAGIKLAKMIRDERTESNRFGGEMAQAVREARRNLSKAEQTEVVKILDGQKPLREASSQAVRDAYKSLRATTEKLGNEAIKAGVRMRDSSGEIVPFDKLSGEYFPHRYPEELFKDPKALRDKLLKAGNSPAAVDAMMDRVTKKGERFSSAQHTRDFDLPGYHETLDALEAHQYEMARVITRAKRFGPGDVSDANSPISKLIKESSSPAKAEEVVNAYLNRKEGTPELEAQQKIANIAVQAEVWSKLSQFFITNMGDLNTSAHTLGIENTSRAFVKTLSDPHNSADIATRSGALGSIKHELANDVTAGKILGKAYGTVSSEKFVRTVEALAGRAEVGRLFELAKKDKRYHSPLSEFVDGDVKEVLKQDKLTDEQLDFASGRAAEMTSGIPDASTLSKAFMAKNPIIRTLSLFKRFSFLNMKNLSEAIKRTPTGPGKVAKIAAMIVGFQVAGEVVGDIKALIKGLASGDISGDIERRGDYIGFKNKTLDRIMANYLQSAFFGLVGDAAESIASRPLGKISGTLGGPVVSDLDEIAGITSDLMTPSKPGGFGKPAGKSRFHSLGMAVAKRIPYIGAGLKERWDKEKEQGLKGLPAIK